MRAFPDMAAGVASACTESTIAQGQYESSATPATGPQQREAFALSWEGVGYEGLLCYQKGLRRPLVLVLPNVEGMNSFDEGQATFLAELGYTGLAVDLYGRYLPREQRQFLTSPSDPDVMTRAFDAMNYWTADIGKLHGVLAAWLEAAREHPSVDPNACAAIGYCFGGLCCLEMVRAGLPVSGVVSFHGVLQPRVFAPPGRPIATRPGPSPKHSNHAKVLVENGQSDHLVPPESIAALEKEMFDAGVDLRIHHHQDAGHGFALHPGRSFNPEADKISTLNMLAFLYELFPEVIPRNIERNHVGTSLI